MLSNPSAQLFSGRLVSHDWSTAFQPADQSVGSPQAGFVFEPLGMYGFPTLEAALRNVRLKGDKSVQVYNRATIELKRLQINSLSPLALYLLQSQISQHTNLFWHLHATYRQNLFDLNGVLDYRQNGTTYRMAPPIIERYQEPTTGEWIAAIIDGLHRIWVARQLGFSEVWVAEISNVSAALPPIATPVNWQDLTIYDAVPPADAKRRFRFQNVDELRAHISSVVTPENYAYFLYRDFSALGSSGIRLS